MARPLARETSSTHRLHRVLAGPVPKSSGGAPRAPSTTGHRAASPPGPPTMLWGPGGRRSTPGSTSRLGLRSAAAMGEAPPVPGAPAHGSESGVLRPCLPLGATVHAPRGLRVGPWPRPTSPRREPSMTSRHGAPWLSRLLAEPGPAPSGLPCLRWALRASGMWSRAPALPMRSRRSPRGRPGPRRASPWLPMARGRPACPPRTARWAGPSGAGPTLPRRAGRRPLEHSRPLAAPCAP